MSMPPITSYPPAWRSKYLSITDHNNNDTTATTTTTTTTTCVISLVTGVVAGVLEANEVTAQYIAATEQWNARLAALTRSIEERQSVRLYAPQLHGMLQALQRVHVLTPLVSTHCELGVSRVVLEHPHVDQSPITVQIIRQLDLIDELRAKHHHES
eukprot:c20230_g1_i1.p1 GENE.c20230_g1_i1~~c20230_g1_i1.p1  ORF type:complete len:156 (+),score=31.70 c20230_g1_i1:187-654(+)